MRVQAQIVEPATEFCDSFSTSFTNSAILDCRGHAMTGFKGGTAIHKPLMQLLFSTAISKKFDMGVSQTAGEGPHPVYDRRFTVSWIVLSMIFVLLLTLPDRIL